MHVQLHMFVEHTNLLQDGVKSNLKLLPRLLESFQGFELLLQLRQEWFKLLVFLNLAFELHDELFHFGELFFPLLVELGPILFKPK